MHNIIEVPGPETSPSLIKIGYSIDVANDIQTINCSLEDAQFPVWLQLRKFSISSVLQKTGRYMPLFNEVNSSKNMATSLFIDRVYARIMKLEHLKIA